MALRSWCCSAERLTNEKLDWESPGRLDFWMPTLMTSIVGEAGASHEIALNMRGDHSIAWPKYSGPLKFVPN